LSTPQQETISARPRPVFAEAAPFGGRLRSARYARLRSASPRRGGGAEKKDNLQKEFYTPLVGRGTAHNSRGRGLAAAVSAGDESELELAGAGEVRAVVQYLPLISEHGVLCGNLGSANQYSHRDEKIPEYFYFHMDASSNFNIFL